MNDFEHVDRYLAQAAEERFDSLFGIPGIRPVHPEYSFVAWPRFDWGEKSGVSELAERLRFLYLEGTEEDADVDQ